jgi:hypothetical protein
MTPPEPADTLVLDFDFIESSFTDDTAGAADLFPEFKYIRLVDGTILPRRARQKELTPSRRRRGPQPGTINRHGPADRNLFPEIERLAKEKGSITAATRQLAEESKVAGTGTPKSRAARLAKAYRQWRDDAETR